MTQMDVVVPESAWSGQEQNGSPCSVPLQFVARQPILDRGQKTFGYELLFRAGWKNFFSGDPEAASRRLIDDALSFGLLSVVGSARPFINCTRSTLLDGLAGLLPTGTVLEVLETESVDAALVSACKRLRAQGFQIALDDFDFSEQWEPMLHLADFIKIDFRNSTAEQRRRLLRRLAHSETRFVAEKVEDAEEFRCARDEGFHLFQGYFFAKPKVLARPALTSIMHRLRLWKELRRPEMDTARVVAILKEEAALSYRLLRFANSALVSTRTHVTSLRTALAMMGTDRFRKMAIVSLTSEICGQQPAEVYRSILQRARLCELMAPHLHQEPTEMYLFGMLAVLRQVLNLSEGEVHALIKLPRELMEGLAGSGNNCAQLLHAASHFDHGMWAEFGSSADALRLNERVLGQFCHEARSWADAVVAEAPDALAGAPPPGTR